MNKHEIKERLRAVHIQYWESAMEFIENGINMGLSNREIDNNPAFVMHTARTNAVITCAETLEVDIGRAQMHTGSIQLRRERLQHHF